MSKLKENLIFLMVAHAAFLSTPALVHAETSEYHPINFIQPLNVSRGKVIQGGQDAFFLNKIETCNLLVLKMGWEESSCSNVDQLVFGYNELIDNVIFRKPVSDGYVKLDDWKSGDIHSEISEITSSYKIGLKQQGERLNEVLTFEGWLVYPTVDEVTNTLYYANIINWGGEKTINISLSLFDKAGYIPIDIVSAESNISESEVKNIVGSVISGYKPNSGESYTEWKSSDKVATYGAVGVFAGMLGVKYGKVASAGIMAVVLMLLKKAWFLLLLPFVALKKVFTRKPKDHSDV